MEYGLINNSFVPGFGGPNSPNHVDQDSALKQSILEDQQGVRLQTELGNTEGEDEEECTELDVTPVIRETDVSDI